MSTDGANDRPPLRRIIQVVPHRTSDPDGIGDYAVRLADALQAHHGIETLFIAGTPEGDEPPARDGWKTARVDTRTAGAMVRCLDEAGPHGTIDAVILHVAGYGYARRGAPLWLLDGVRTWRRADPSTRLVGIFHELYATSAPWHSAFWIGPFQKHVTRGFVDLVDAVITPSTNYAREISAWSPSRAGEVTVCPVPSNVGEPSVITPLNERQARAAVFGRTGVEDVIYGRHHRNLEAAVANLGIKEIIDIGSRSATVPDRIGGVAVRKMGRLPAGDVSAALQSCQFGLLAYNAVTLGKSTILAAYAAHGTVPVLLNTPNGTLDADLEAGRTILTAHVPNPIPDVLSGIQTALLAWYRGHSTAHLARIVAEVANPGMVSSAAGPLRLKPVKRASKA